MIVLDTSGRNLILYWDSMQERKILDKLRDRRPIYKIDQDGDSVLHHYEFPKNSIREILAAFPLEKFNFSEKAKPFINSFLIETAPIDSLPKIEGDLGIVGTPKPFQENFLRINKGKNGMILSMSTGSGKTKTSLWRSQILDGGHPKDFRMLVICPKRLLLMGEWEEEIYKTLGQTALRFWAIGKDRRQKLLDQLPNYNIVCTSYDQAAFLEGFQFDHLNIDEGHLIRGDHTKRYKAVAKKVKEAKKSVIVNTATPKPNKLSGLWALGKLVAPNLFGSKKSFLAKFQKPTKFMQMEKVMPSGQITTFRVPIDFKEINHEELSKFISPVVYTVPKEEIIDFEDCLEYRDLEMLPRQKRAYQTLAAELLEKKKNNDLEDGEILQYLLRLKQISEGLHLIDDYKSIESNKLNFIRETIEDLDDGEHIIIWSCFQKGIKLLHEEFKDRSVLFCGTVTPSIMELGKKAFCGVESPEQYKEYERLRNKQKNWKFEPGEATVMMAVSHDWTSLGLNLQALCSRQLVMTTNDLYDTDKQAWARISRLGQKADFVLTELLFSKGTANREDMLDKLEKDKIKTDVFQGKNSRSRLTIEEQIEQVRRNL